MWVDKLGIYRAVILFLFIQICVCEEEGICDRRPLGTKALPLPPDNRFLIEIKEIRQNMYIPKQTYEVRLHSRDMESQFIAFTISLKPATMYNKANPRKPLLLKPGFLEAIPNTNAKHSRGCENTIIQSDITPKTEVKVFWTAPEKDNACVTIFAVVAVQPDVWYSYEGPLSRQVCEDRRKADDMQPIENDNCTVCEDARYQLTFEGMWSHNTHPLMFPEARELARFSDVVGASHSSDFNLYKYSSEATPGLKMLAEQGNTTVLEFEILDSMSEQIDSTRVRTLIKASAPPQPNLSTTANFRVTAHHHLVSLATAILPSPDWFLGVSNLELCDATSNMWSEQVIFNLYPQDAGTDSGRTFEAANEATSPQQPITTADITKLVNTEEMKPFARLIFTLVRTYSTNNCSEETTGTEKPAEEEGNSGDSGNDDGNEQEYRPVYQPSPATTTTSEEPSSAEPDLKNPDCPVTTWGEWGQCDGDCENNKLTGYQTRFRVYLNDPKPECVAEMPTEEFQPCEEDCEPEQQEEYDDEIEE